MVDSPSKIAKPGHDTAELTTEFAKPVCLVAVLWGHQQPQSNSIFMVDAVAVVGGNEDPPSARALGNLPGAEHGMSYVPKHSEHDIWIVGVGGPSGSTTIFDPRSMPVAGTLRGPELSYPKDEPILISHGLRSLAPTQGAPQIESSLPAMVRVLQLQEVCRLHLPQRLPHLEAVAHACDCCTVHGHDILNYLSEND